MKRFVIIALIILVAGSLVLIPLLKNNHEEPVSGFPASFNFDENLGTPYGSDVPIAFTVNEDVKLIELVYNDSVFKTWESPRKGQKITYQIDADYYGLGSRGIVLRTTRTNGDVEEDSRMLRVYSDTAPELLVAKPIGSSFPHDPTRYTQGLEFSEGQLYEGTGDPGQKGASLVGATDLKTGKWVASATGDLKNGLDASYFGEGITIMGDKLYELTWQSGKCFVYDKKTMKLLKDFTYTGEGWGLCNDGKYLIMSDGTEHIYFRDPETFEIVRTIEVYDNQGPRTALNELEYVDGKIYANVYTTNFVLTIDPNMGKVLGVIDATPLLSQGQLGGEVLNGIAYNPATKKLYMTGKYWRKILEVSISK